MNGIILPMIFCLCGFTIAEQKPFSSTWRFVDPGWSTDQSHTEIHLIDRQQGTIPFFWNKISYTLLDSMAAEHPRQDSIQKRFEQGQSSEAGYPVTIVIDTFELTHAERKRIIVNSCEYKVEVFTIEKPLLVNDAIMISPNHYELFYLKGIGIIGAVLKKQTQLSPEWVRYQLEDIVDKKGQSIVNKEELKAIVTKVMIE